MKSSSILVTSLAGVSATLTPSYNTSSNSPVVVPYEYTYILPNGFVGNENYTFANGTTTNDPRINALLKSATQAPIVAYDAEFSNIFGSNPAIKLVQDRSAQDDMFAHEAGVWVPERNEVWFSNSPSQLAVFPGTVYVLSLDTGHVGPLNSSSKVRNPNGGYYFEGKVYFTSIPGPANDTYPGGIISVDVHTLETQTIVNSYFGLHFNGPDDIVWVYNPANRSEKYMFFTDLDFTKAAYPNGPSPMLPSSVYRWDPQNEILRPVISRNDLSPNGIRVTPDMKTLYVPDSSSVYESFPTGVGVNSWLGPFIYAYKLDEDMLPSSRTMFGQVRLGIADGIHVDDSGRVWTGESEGVVCRNSLGKVIGVLNGEYFLANTSAEATPIANFALAGDTIVVLAGTRLWTVQAEEVLVSSNSSKPD
ncbi:hypothetical protein BDY17DRAFT_321195 [Neohortaea acidophila]|uniref:SMP-30/Gluconolactonase/LRE-like region domain-containing protein n=1 Tax=Neohortaea acidophila TaxID=245834 RepID=A0A6A6Q368_9PEZI|nr:uncharacterized protein BDY17DRAFT_321195 [Neohortaea acidophila]KAF2486396.1 hypothetical protein BDY17DRAFT_321195 [Neohortaea acidophila]